jgi:hypothetical protein
MKLFLNAQNCLINFLNSVRLSARKIGSPDKHFRSVFGTVGILK